jgi:4-oxalocrotonate tautomerase
VINENYSFFKSILPWHGVLSQHHRTRECFMPFVNIKVAGFSLAPEQVQRLQSEATRMMAEVMRKKRESTAVLVEQVDAAKWTVGAVPVRAAAHLDVKVTAGTNTPDEKRRFASEVMALMRSVIGPALNPVCYVIVHEVSGDAWGYDGRTQSDRAADAKAA